MSNVVKLPRHSRATREQAKQLRQYALDLRLSEEARAELDNALYRVTEVPGKRWLFVMINPEQFRFVARAIMAGPDAGKTLMVWNCALTHLRMDTGEIVADRDQLAEDAGMRPCHVSSAMTELTKIGAVTRERRGRKMAYFINPQVGWNGGEGARQEALRTAPPLRLVPKTEPDEAQP